MENLSKRNKAIVRLYSKGFSFKEIAHKYSLSKSHVRRIQIICSKRTLTKTGKVLKIPIKYKAIYEPVKVENLKVLNRRKREYLGLPLNVYSSTGGGRNFTREIIRERDNQTCQGCFKKWKQNTRKFDVHHLEETMLGKTREKETLKYDRENMDKLITFCHKCHFNWHRDKGHTKSWNK